MNDLIKDLKMMVCELSTKLEGHDPNDPILEKVDKLLSRHEGAKEEGCVVCALDTDKDCPIGRFRCGAKECPSFKPTPDKAVEPLAVLANNHGYFINGVYIHQPENKIWKIQIAKKMQIMSHLDNWHIFEGPTYAAAEAKARAYLEGLEDKK